MIVEKTVRISIEPEDYQALKDVCELAGRYIRQKDTRRLERMNDLCVDEYDLREVSQMRALITKIFDA